MTDSKILLDCRPVRSPISGVARYCLGLSEALLRSSSFRPSLLIQAQKGQNEFVDLLPSAAQKVQSRFFPGDRRLQNVMLEFLPSSHSALFGRKYDILHETYFADIGHRKNARKVATIHDVIPLDRPELFSKRNVTFSKRNFHRQVREADHIISVSDYTRQRILEFYPDADDRISVIGNGVDPRIVHGPKITPLAKDDVLAGRPFVSSVGNIEPRKNLLTLAKGFDAAFPAGSDWRLVIAGRRNFDADRILREITDLLGDRFVYLGPVDEDRKWQVIAHAEATVMPSEYEGFGIPILESYAVRTPVLIADNSSMSELAVDKAQLFGTFDVDQLADGLLQIANQQSWIPTALDDGLNYVKACTWDQIAADTASVYSRLA